MAQAAQAAIRFIGRILVKVGVSQAAASAIATVVVTTTIAVAKAVGLAYLSRAAAGGARPDLPKAEDGKAPIRQDVPLRLSGYGRARIAGAYMLYEERAGVSYDVVALHDGPIDAIEQIYLNEDAVGLFGDVVTEGAGGRYAGGVVRVQTRLGAATETAYPRVVAGLPGVWTADHRGDAIASLALECASVANDRFATVYPNGLPGPSAVARLQRVFDPRDGAQSFAAPQTWTWSRNPVLHLLHYLTDPVRGMGLNYARRIAPALASWRQAASDCDALVEVSPGVTEPRYTAGGWYPHNADPIAVVDSILTTCDGWIAARGDGALVVSAGVWRAPTVTLEDEHVLEYGLQRFVPDEESVNELTVLYTEPGLNWSEAPAEPWLDIEDKAARGFDRVSSVSAPWIQSRTQARRIAKREVARANATARGWVRCTLYGLEALAERYLRLRLARGPATLRDLTVEVQQIEIDFTGMTVLIEWIALGAEIDEWSPTGGAGQPPTVPPVTPPGVTPLPTPAGVVAFAEYDVNLNPTGLRVTFSLPAAWVGAAEAVTTRLELTRVDVAGAPQVLEILAAVAGAPVNGFVSCTLVQMPFAPGEYRLRAAVRDVGGAPGAWSEPPVIVTAFDPTNNP